MNYVIGKTLYSAFGDGLLQLNFQTVHASGLYKAQIAATLAVTSKGREVIDGSRKWKLFCLSPDEDQQSCSNKKHRKSGGSNLIPVIEELLSSSSNWYEITETSQYQYPGVFSRSSKRYCQTSLPWLCQRHLQVATFHRTKLPPSLQ